MQKGDFGHKIWGIFQYKCLQKNLQSVDLSQAITLLQVKQSGGIVLNSRIDFDQFILDTKSLMVWRLRVGTLVVLALNWHTTNPIWFLYGAVGEVFGWCNYWFQLQRRWKYETRSTVIVWFQFRHVWDCDGVEVLSTSFAVTSQCRSMSWSFWNK